ncbi:MAG TPA: replication protein [Pyrinomonadaceae bacterium]|jgi:hypothetical protein
MVKKPQEQEQPREAKPKFRGVLPANYQIRRSPSPMADMLRDAETHKPVENTQPVENPPDSSHANFASLEPIASHENIASQAEFSSQANSTPPALQIARLENSASLAKTASPNADLLAGLPQVKGYLRLHHQLIDHLFPQLDPKEQAVYLHLYRLSWGFGKPTVFISNPRLAERAGMSTRGIQDVTARLVSKNLISKVRQIIGQGQEQGIEWSVEIPPSLAKFASHENSASLATVADNIERKDLKKDSKRESASPNLQNCPDCHGTGFQYVDELDRAKGVEKCLHKNLE